MLKSSKLPDGFQRRVFKDNIRGKGCRVSDQLMNIFFIGWW